MMSHSSNSSRKVHSGIIRLLFTVLTVCGFAPLGAAASFVEADSLPSYVPTEGLILWFNLDSSAVNVNPATTGQMNGIVDGPAPINDRYGRAAAMLFDGVDDWIEVPDSEAGSICATTTQSLSVSFWGRNVDGDLPFISKYVNTVASNSNFMIVQTQVGKLAIYGNGTNVLTATSQNDEWTHYVVQFKAGTNQSKVYENSQLIFEGTLNYSSSCSNYSFNIGTEKGFQNYSGGALDDLGLWNRELTEEEIKTLYASETTSIGQPGDGQWTEIQSVTKSFSNSWTETLLNTDSSKVYRLEVSGTYGIANGTPHRDAAYDLNSKGLMLGCDGHWSLNGQCPSPPPVYPRTYAEDNVYEYDLGTGVDGGYIITFTDGLLSDNSGSLTFTLYAAPAAEYLQVPDYLPADGLLAWYPLYDTFNDESGNSRHGTSKAATFGYSEPSQEFQTPADGAYFEGTKAWAQIPSPFADGKSREAISYSYWFRPVWNPTYPFGKEWYHIFGVINSTYSFGNRFAAMDSSQFQFQWPNKNGVQYNELTISEKEYLHVVAVKDSTEIRHYMNGVLIDTKPADWTFSLASSHLYIARGLNNQFDYYMHGWFDDLAIWDRALSDEDVANLYSRALPAGENKLSERSLVLDSVRVKTEVPFSVTVSLDSLTAGDSLAGLQFTLGLPADVTFDSLMMGPDNSYGVLHQTNRVGDTLSVAVSSSEFLTSPMPLLELFFTAQAPGEYSITPTRVKLNDIPISSVQSGAVTVGEFTPGDVNDSGELDNYDASVILHKSVGRDLLPLDPVKWWEPTGSWNLWRYATADVDQDGLILAMDATYVLKYVVGLIEEFPSATPPAPKVTIEVTERGLQFTSTGELESFNVELPQSPQVEYLIPELSIENAAGISNGEEGLRYAVASADAITGGFLEIPLRVNTTEMVTLNIVTYSNSTRHEHQVTFSGLTVTNETQDEVPTLYALGQNYPNPFNPSTRLEFSLPKAEYVTLEVYNSFGQSVMTLVDGYKTAGVHVVDLDASTLSSGVYVYRLVTPSYSSTRSMILVK